MGRGFPSDGGSTSWHVPRAPVRPSACHVSTITVDQDKVGAVSFASGSHTCAYGSGAVSWLSRLAHPVVPCWGFPSALFTALLVPLAFVAMQLRPCPTRPPTKPPTAPTTSTTWSESASSSSLQEVRPCTRKGAPHILLMTPTRLASTTTLPQPDAASLRVPTFTPTPRLDKQSTPCSCPPPPLTRPAAAPHQPPPPGGRRSAAADPDTVGTATLHPGHGPAPRLNLRSPGRWGPRSCRRCCWRYRWRRLPSRRAPV